MSTRRFAAVSLAAVFALSLGCTSMKGLTGRRTTEKATAKSQKDIAACEKMCAVAGDAEGNAAAVTACKKDCRN
jgi:hypothetical protein